MEYFEKLTEIYNKYFDQKNVSEAVYYTLVDAVTEGVLQPGTRVYESELAESLQVSRTPIREAIKRLIIEDYLVYSEHGNVCVKEYSVDEICSIIQSMEDIRIITAKEATETINRIYISRIKEVLDRIDTISAEYPGEKDQERAAQVFKLDDEFHRLVCEASGNSYMIKFYNRLSKMLKVIMNTTLFGEMGYAYSFEAQNERRRIFQALLERNPSEAMNQALLHSQRAIDRMNVISVLSNGNTDFPNRIIP